MPTGTPVFDWTVPKEWNVRDAYIRNAQGEKVVDFQAHNLHLVSYSVPVRRTMSLEELRPHLFALPEQPDLIPYRTAYYAETWGFCLTQQQLDALEDGQYEVVMDTTLADGHLTYGELLLPGAQADEILISCHSCHPSLANDNLSGMVLATALAETLAALPHRYSYRFVFAPGTIGAITWLALHETDAARIAHGLVVACVGDPGPVHYKKSRRGDAEIDRAVQHVLRHSGAPFAVRDFSPYGYDERQYCSPGFNLPVGSLTRTPHGQFPEYHTSADNLDFVQPAALADSLRVYLDVLSVLEQNRTFSNTNPRCEPQLGRRGLYRQFGGKSESKALELAMLWVLNLSDGAHSLLAIADQAELPLRIVAEAAAALQQADLLLPVERDETLPGPA